MTACTHQHGEYTDDYRRCTDCGMEWMLLGDAWFEIESWLRLSEKFFDEPELASAPKEPTP